MDFVSDILPLIFSLIAVVAVLYGCYLFSKFLSKKVNHISNSNNIRIVERVALAQDKGMAIAEICGIYYLIGFANNNIEIIKELDEQDIKIPQAQNPAGSFLEILNATLKKRTDVKKLDSDELDKTRNAESGEEEKRDQD